MTLPTPRYTRSQVNRAGRVLIAENPTIEQFEWARDVLTNWRACHAYPVNTFQATLRKKLQHIDKKAIVAQRLKRTPSIISKLQRFEGMNLARMQDIGGLRAVVGSLQQARDLEMEYRQSRFTHELVGSSDYIKEPKETGYRSIHLVYRYKNLNAPAYDKLQLELQIRTKLQHAWATAVETMGTFLGQALKSSQGEQQWLRFFEVTGSAFAYIERSTLVPGYEHLSRQDTFKAVAAAEADLGVLDKLDGFSIALNAISTDKGRGSYHIVVLDSASKTVEIKSYGRNRLDEAALDYAAVETRAARGEMIEAVLVSAGPIESLRRAYPNYFLDTRDFIRRVKRIIQLGKLSELKERTRHKGQLSISF